MISIGDKLDGKYVVARKLGGGGFGDVYLATDEAIPDRQVAIKVLATRSAGDHRDLIWEMQALAGFHHQGVVGFYHHFTDASQLFLVMEFCAGGSLDDRLLAAGRTSEGDVFGWALTLCETLSFVHEKGIVHHDIKPANILFTKDNAIKLGDFGVANREGGTRLYLPPEMLLGERVTRTDPRVDVYALGLTLLEALTGRHPFEDVERDQAIQARIAHDFVPPDLPRWVQEVVLKATHPTPELRFQTMRDFAEAIRGKHVPYVFDGNRIKAHALAEKAEARIARKKWRSAEKLLTRALQLSPDCVAALLAAGRCQLLIRRIDQAREYFSRAVSISPRTHVQKELGWLSLEEGRLPTAISLLTDHLQRNSSDYEAYNLLMKCFFLSERFEAGENLARTLMDEKAPNECFRNNRFVCRLLNGGYTAAELEQVDAWDVTNPFISYNLSVATEKPRAWAEERPPYLRSKVLFQEYRFGTALRIGRQNKLALHMPDAERREIASPIVTVGSLEANEIRLGEASVSRRHAVIVNLPDDVWIYDLASTQGIYVGGHRLAGRMFLDGVHEVSIGRASIRVGASADLLV